MLTVRIIDLASVPGGRGVALCDADGEPLPMQRSADLSQRLNDVSEITVTFAIDGKQIKFLG